MAEVYERIQRQQHRRIGVIMAENIVAEIKVITPAASIGNRAVMAGGAAKPSMREWYGNRGTKKSVGNGEKWWHGVCWRYSFIK